MFPRLNDFARMVMCGMIAEYNDTSPRPGPNLMACVRKRLRIQGFIVSDSGWQRYGRFRGEMLGWMRDGRLYVKVKSAPWRHQLHLQREGWRHRLNQHLGREIVAEVVFC